MVLLPVLDACFDGYRYWDSDLFLQKMTRRDEVAKVSARQKRRKTIQSELKSGLVNPVFISITAVFIGATAVYFTIPRHRPGPRVAVTFGAAVIMQAIGFAGAYNVRRRDGDITTLLNVGVIKVLYTWTLAAFMFAAVLHSDRLVMGLGIAGGIFLVFYGVVLMLVPFKYWY